MKTVIKYIKEKFRRKSKTFFTSDLHFSHKKVIEYCKRPFKDVEEMNEAIIKEWNKTVKKQDTVWILGDFSLNPNAAFRVVKRLNGKKFLVAGNHDSCFLGHKKYAKFIVKYLDNGFDMVIEHYTDITLKNGIFVKLSHLPYWPLNGGYDMRYKDYRPINNEELLLHGHLHGRYIKNGKMIDVSWDAHNGKILSEDELIAIINDPKEFIPSHLTESFKIKVSNENAD
jgi:calcineurin-like phosphoesterase family protein